MNRCRKKEAQKWQNGIIIPIERLRCGKIRCRSLFISEDLFIS